MDLSEVLFKSLSNWNQTRTKSIKQETGAFFEDEQRSLSLLFNSFHSEKRIPLQKYKGIGMSSPDEIFFPESIQLFSEKSLNRKLLLHKALMAGAIIQYDIRYWSDDFNPFEKSLQILSSIPQLQILIRNHFPNYDEFFKELFEALEKAPFKQSQINLEFYRVTKQVQLVRGIDEIKGVCEQNKRLSQHLRHFPEASLCLGFGLLPHSLPNRNRPQVKLESENQRKSENHTEKEGHASETKLVNLNEESEKENPVMHSFESLHTADEYQGGRRVVDGEDELSDHQNALEELNLDSVTRDNTATQSTYKASFSLFENILDSKRVPPRGTEFKYYPEWDYKKNDFKENHCRLYLTTPTVNSPDSEWKTRLSNNYRSQLLNWQKKIETLVNKEVWINRQWEGPELDLDSYVNFHCDLKHGKSNETPLYQRKRRHSKEMASVLLFDQSFSTDSWVQNQRVLDIELEAIGLTGLLTRYLNCQTSIAGTWSETRNHCYYQTYKAFDDPWDSFYNVASQIEPRGYTRLGPSIRHAIKQLDATKAKQKLLILLTDGKPTDYDKYEGRYGLEDIYKAVQSAKKFGINIKALAVEKEAIHHFPILFGNSGYKILNNVDQFPQSLWRIYLESSGLL